MTVNLTENDGYGSLDSYGFGCGEFWNASGDGRGVGCEFCEDIDFDGDGIGVEEISK